MPRQIRVRHSMRAGYVTRPQFLQTGDGGGTTATSQSSQRVAGEGAYRSVQRLTCSRRTVPAPLIASHQRVGLPVSVLTLLNLRRAEGAGKGSGLPVGLRFGKQLNLKV